MKNISIKLRLIILIFVSVTVVLTGVTVTSIKLFKQHFATIIDDETTKKVEFLNTFLFLIMPEMFYIIRIINRTNQWLTTLPMSRLWQIHM